MAPSAEAGARQALFDRWVQGLGLPLRTDLAGLSIGVVRDASGAAALLLESPEPLDFTTEITPTLTRRVGVWTTTTIRHDATGAGLAERLRELDGSLVDGPASTPPVAPTVTVTAVDAHPEGLRLDLADAGGGLRAGQVVNVARTDAPDHAPRFFSGTVRRRHGEGASVVVTEVGILATRPQPPAAVGWAGGDRRRGCAPCSSP